MEACSANLTMPVAFGARPTSAQHPKAQGARPNILFVLSDQQRYDFDGHHADVALEVPILQRLGSEGVRFTAAFSPSPLCGPSRSCIAVGRQYHETLPHLSSDGFNGGPPRKFETFYASLRRNGYHTMTCGKDDLQKGDAQKAGRNRDFDAAGLNRLGFADFERSLGKKNVFALKGKAADQYGDFLLRLGDPPPEVAPLAPLKGLALPALEAHQSSPAGSEGRSPEAHDGDGDLFLGRRGRLLRARRPARATPSGSGVRGGRPPVRNGTSPDDAAAVPLAGEDAALSSSSSSSRIEAGRAHARHWASGFPAGGGYPDLGRGSGAALRVVDATYKQCRQAAGAGNGGNAHPCPPFPASFPDEAQEDSFVGRQALRLLRRRPKQLPFFLQVNFPSPHDPYTVTQCMARAARQGSREGGRGKVGSPDEEARRGYGALCEHVDVWLGRFLEELAAEPASGADAEPTAHEEERPTAASTADTGDGGDGGTAAAAAGATVAAVAAAAAAAAGSEAEPHRARPFTREALAAARAAAKPFTRSVLDVTLVCFTSDHGDMLGDGGKWGKQVPGQGSVAVPLVCRGPPGLALGVGGGTAWAAGDAWAQRPPALVRRGVVVQQPVSIADLGPTFLDVAGVRKPPSMTGRSLLPVLLGHATPHDVRRVVVSALKEWRVAVAAVRVAPPDRGGWAAADAAVAGAAARLVPSNAAAAAANAAANSSSSRFGFEGSSGGGAGPLVSHGVAPELAHQVGKPAVAGPGAAGCAGHDGSLWVTMISTFGRKGPQAADGLNDGSWKLVDPASNHYLPGRPGLPVKGLVEAANRAFS